MGDYIDRESYCKTICRCDREYCDKEKCPIWTALAADVRPVVRGRWVKQRNDPLDGDFYCSACHSRIDIETGLETPIGRGLFFCPHCGADMREETNCE